MLKKIIQGEVDGRAMRKYKGDNRHDAGVACDASVSEWKATTDERYKRGGKLKEGRDMLGV